MEREKLQQQYARILLQLATEAKTMANNKPTSKLYRSAKQTIIASGETLTKLRTEWQELHRISYTEPILQELFDYAGYE